MKAKEAKYLFLISNTGRSVKKGTHWSVILYLHSKAKFSFFDSLGMDGLKNFIIEETEKMPRTDKKTNTSTNKLFNENFRFKERIRQFKHNSSRFLSFH